MNLSVIIAHTNGILLCIKLSKLGHNVTGIVLNNDDMEKLRQHNSIKVIHVEKLLLRNTIFKKKEDAVIISVEDDMTKTNNTSIKKILTKLHAKKIIISSCKFNFNILDLICPDNETDTDADIEHFILKSFHY